MLGNHIGIFVSGTHMLGNHIGIFVSGTHMLGNHIGIFVSGTHREKVRKNTTQKIIETNRKSD
jgi:hypothetical protein